MLSVHGRRNDGFHALTSLVAPLEFGDYLTIREAASHDQLLCSDPRVPIGDKNLILQAATAFRSACGRAPYFLFELEKHIPMQAGLGGGSSNAAVALRGMNQWMGHPLSHADLLELAAQIGSDCPFFIDAKPAVIRGRGEIVEPLLPELSVHVAQAKLLLFRPELGVDTAWAYQQPAGLAPSGYESEAVAQQRLQQFDQDGDWSALMVNSLELPVGTKYLAIPCLLQRLRDAGVDCMLSGSGSCCVARVASEAQVEKVSKIIRDAWGDAVFVVETSVAQIESKAR